MSWFAELWNHPVIQHKLPIATLETVQMVGL